MYEGEFPHGWKKGVKVVNLPVSVKKGSISKSAKPKFAKKGKDVPEVCLEIVPYKGGLPSIGNIILESTPPPSARARSIRRSAAAKSRPLMPRQPLDASPSSSTHGNKRKTSPSASFTSIENRVYISNFSIFFILVI